MQISRAVTSIFVGGWSWGREYQRNLKKHITNVKLIYTSLSFLGIFLVYGFFRNIKGEIIRSMYTHDNPVLVY